MNELKYPVCDVLKSENSIYVFLLIATYHMHVWKHIMNELSYHLG